MSIQLSTIQLVLNFIFLALLFMQQIKLSILNRYIATLHKYVNTMFYMAFKEMKKPGSTPFSSMVEDEPVDTTKNTDSTSKTN